MKFVAVHYPKFGLMPDYYQVFTSLGDCLAFVMETSGYFAIETCGGIVHSVSKSGQ